VLQQRHLRPDAGDPSVARPRVLRPSAAGASKPDRRPGDDGSRPGALRGYSGPHADELAILCRADVAAPDAARQAERAYRALAALLADRGASCRHLTSETLFLRDVRRDLPAVLEARARVLAELRQADDAPLPAFVEQAPVADGAALELAAWAVVPHRHDAWSVRDVRATTTCPCPGCARTGARLVRLGDQTSLHTTNVYGRGGDAFTQALATFDAAERLLAECGMDFRDVVRTWIHVRDIARDYDALNRARREFFRRAGIALRPASTGVQGGPFPDAHDFAITLHAVRSARPLDVAPMSAPTLNEAWTYGADFSRGLRLVDANKTAIHVSGTASIDEAGRTVHVGDLAGQAERMLRNVVALLGGAGATLAQVASGVTYVKDRGLAPVVRAALARHGLDDVPMAFVEAPLCRPELLCEMEVVALLPPPAAAT
jgi:enamine deaminase RidA (YjgF/YER057c/UK114 family)